MSLNKILTQGLDKLRVTLDVTQQQKLLTYLQLLHTWNKVHNLTAIKDLNIMVSYHLLDSLSILNLVANYSNIIDVGTGAGLPGIPLAIALPQCQITLLDSNIKKIVFLQKVVAQLQLENIVIVHSRAEQYHPAAAFALVLSRACANIATLIKFAAHLCAVDGNILAMKSAAVESELVAMPAEFMLAKLQQLEVPNVAGVRFAAVIKRV
ncbi:MAG: 16S rRNA (guanine(527)-N(7))-methyltransferase RsmG [Legionellales bacterium]|nr:MAG: 16S rRNA (guanine(527)-N(7))-methyltransferase RsmG [Legionellales bacterium]